LDKFLNKIICGDCLEVMRDIPDKSVDLVLTDPPYGIDFQSCKRKKEERFVKIANDKTPFIEWVEDAFRITKDGGAVVCFCRWDVEQSFLDELNRVGYEVKSQLIWHKKGFGMGDLKREFAATHENAWFGIKGNYNFPGKRPATVITMQKVDNDKIVHPNEKPVNLMAYLINTLTEPGMTILDPFLGSGTTAIAAHNTGRKFIGIEKEPKYVEIARKRLEQAQMQQSLFA